MPSSIQELNDRFGLAKALCFEAGQGGLTQAKITTAQAKAHIYLHGAHVTHFQRRGKQPALFMSPKSHFQDGKPIRGGVPVIFPWFGPLAGQPQAPSHGFVRVRAWEVESAGVGNDGALTLTLLLCDSPQTLALWPHRFEIRHRVTVGDQLTMSLEVRNPLPRPRPRDAARQGPQDESGQPAFRVEEALHTYFTVGDIRSVKVTGLEGIGYIDKTCGGERKIQEGPIHITGETDRVYLGTTSNCMLDDPALGRRMSVAKTGSQATVIWNPWIAKSRAMEDFGDDEWQGMICMETANVAEHAVTLPSGANHVMTARIEYSP